MSDSESREIRAILADLQEEIRRHRSALGEARAGPRPDPLARVRQHQVVNPHLPIGWPVMPRGIIPKISALAQKVTRRLLRWYINPIVAQQNQHNAAVGDLLAALQAQADQRAARLDELAGRVAALDALNKESEQASAVVLAELRARTDAQLAALHAAAAQEHEVVNLRLGRLEGRSRSGGDASSVAPAGIQNVSGIEAVRKPPLGLAGLPNGAQVSNDRLSHPIQTPFATTLGMAAAPVTAGGLDTFLLGAQFRNDAQMQGRLGDYDDLFGELAAGAPVLDIGCGRGQLVAHLAELGLAAYGVDSDADAVATGQANGRNVRHADAFAHLAELAPGSLAAISMIQVAEHLTVPDLARLLGLTARALAPGGLLIMETLNPTCLHALANWYLLDPTHRTPLHPQVARFLLEGAGLWQVQIRDLHPVPPEERLTPGGEDAGNIERLNRFLYGPQDYAGIARKPEA